MKRKSEPLVELEEVRQRNHHQIGKVFLKYGVNYQNEVELNLNED